MNTSLEINAANLTWEAVGETLLSWCLNTGVKILIALVLLMVSFRIINLVSRRIEKGTKLKEGLVATANKHGFDLRVTGVPSLFYLRIADDPTLMLHQEWIAECVKRGVFFTNHHNHFINAALTDADIAETIDVADEAFAVVRKRR